MGRAPKPQNNPNPATASRKLTVLDVLDVVQRFAADWKPERHLRPASVRPELRRQYTATQEDGKAVRDLVLAICDALQGESWAPIRAAHAALKMPPKDETERRARVVYRIEEIRWAWERCDLRRRNGERATAWEARQDYVELHEKRLAKSLIDCLADLHGHYSDLSVRFVRDVLREKRIAAPLIAARLSVRAKARFGSHVDKNVDASRKAFLAALDAMKKRRSV